MRWPLTPTLSPQAGRGRSAEGGGEGRRWLTIKARLAAQPSAHRRARAARPAGGRDRRQRLGQEHARARRAARQSAVHQPARRQAELARLRGDRRLAADRPRAGGRPDADRQDAALVPGHLHRLLGHDPQAVRRDARSQGARLRAGALLLQHRRRALPGLRRAGHAHDRDELPARRQGAVRPLPRRALQRRDAGGDVARQEHRRRAADGSGRGGRVLRVDAGRRASAAAAEGRRPRLPHAGPAVADAVAAARRSASSSSPS